mmetsp:Transcript_3207/g.9996  ORF Transcript_3207/g.9996 Transcript_3207/m.9996 type:complete len:234 (-) Transcript_3207:443-1144(-)
MGGMAGACAMERPLVASPARELAMARRLRCLCSRRGATRDARSRSRRWDRGGAVGAVRARAGAGRPGRRARPFISGRADMARPEHWRREHCIVFKCFARSHREPSAALASCRCVRLAYVRRPADAFPRISVGGAIANRRCTRLGGAARAAVHGVEKEAIRVVGSRCLAGGTCARSSSCSGHCFARGPNRRPCGRRRRRHCEWHYARASPGAQRASPGAQRPCAYPRVGGCVLG